MAEYGILGTEFEKCSAHAVGRQGIVSVREENILAQSGFERANCVLEVAPGSVGILTQIGGRKPKALSNEIGGYGRLLRGGRESTVADQPVHIFPL
jgi:hypothetical protein